MRDGDGPVLRLAMPGLRGHRGSRHFAESAQCPKRKGALMEVSRQAQGFDPPGPNGSCFAEALTE